MNFLLEEWKKGAGEIGKRLPKFQPEPTEQVPDVEQPTFNACKVVDGHLQIPQETKNQWITDPIRASEWRKTLQDFDRKWGPHSPGTPQTPAPSTPATTCAPVEDQPAPDPPVTSWDEIFVGEPKNKQDLEAKYGPGAHSFSVNNNVTGIIVEGPKLFFVGTAHAELDEKEGQLFFGAGTWLLDTKATTFAEDRVGNGISNSKNSI